MNLLSVCLIVRNEQAWLSGCLDSLRGLAQDVVVIDTGSNDQTPNLARRYGCRVFHHPWTDSFADARNHAVAKARGRWILSIDADERMHLEGTRQELTDLLRHTSCQAFQAVVISPLTGSGLMSDLVPESPFVLTDLRVVLFRNDPQVRYRHRVHENLWDSLQERYGRDLWVGRAPLWLEHLGYTQDALTLERKRDRNLELLIQERQESGPGPWLDYCLATELLGRGEAFKAVTLLEPLVRKHPEVGFWAQAASTLAYGYWQTGQWVACRRVCKQVREAGGPLGFGLDFLVRLLDWLDGKTVAQFLEQYRRRSPDDLTDQVAAVLAWQRMLQDLPLWSEE